VTGDSNTQTQRPGWIASYLTTVEIEQISQTVHKVEAQVQAEIIPMIVMRSSAVGHVTPLIMLNLMLVFIPLEFYYFQWSLDFNLWLGFSVLGAYLLARWASCKLWVQRIFTSDADETAQVWRRAELEFYRQKTHHTKDRNGILLFVSIMERKAVLLADETIAREFPADTWAPIVQEFSLSLKAGHWGEGFQKTLERCRELLAEKFPSRNGQPRNELANFLRITE